VRDEVIERAKTGEAVPVAEVKRTIDKAKGRQPAHKPVRARRATTHVCWQCGRRGEVGEVQEHRYPAYDDADVWLHDACIAAFAERQQPEVAAAAPGDDIGPGSTGEIARKEAEIEELKTQFEELQKEARSLLLQLAAAKFQIEELKTKHRFRDVTGKDLLAVITELDMPVGWTAEEIIAEITHPNLIPEHVRRAAELLHQIADALAIRAAPTANLEVAEAKVAVATAPEGDVDDGLDMPASLRRTPAPASAQSEKATEKATADEAEPGSAAAATVH
jgi:hypothetical protein